MTNLRRVRSFVKSRMQHALIAVGVEQYLPTEDRRVLETIILPYLQARSEYKSVLFIGCDWYTRGYRKFFDPDTYWTLEIDPAKKRYGSKNHIIDSMENVDQHFPADSLDLIICNGVFGWGLNENSAVESAFRACHKCLRAGGMFILGWNDTPERRPFPLEESKSLALFRRTVFPALGESRFVTDTAHRHVYDFYLK